ncbi:MAG TPA: glycoside hydrolase family 30 beta sandwich domain-containing protein [Streptosporangiaceae bacterium]|nr:glycoside hydrolase family 30 beta sandwich domain-containing protein [Streptosporangiaceae bacterium]
MAPGAHGPAEFSRRQIMTSSALATISLLAGGCSSLAGQLTPVPLAADGEAGAPMPQPSARAPRPSQAGQSSQPAQPGRPRLRMTTTSDLTTVWARSPLPAFTRVTGAAAGDVTVSPHKVFQPFLGAGAALTDSAAYVLTHYMTAAQRHALLRNLFSAAGSNWQMLRVCIGSADFRSEETGYTYADGAADPALSGFSVARDTAFITPVIKEILAINPAVRILATPWTPPKWMLAGGSFEAGDGAFNDSYMASYARYFVRFIESYRSLGIPIWAITTQNEPVDGWFTQFSPAQQSDFIGAYLGPALAAAGLQHVKILAMDDQWSKCAYGQAVYVNDAAHRYTAGIAYHGYAGSPAVMSPAYGEQHLTEWRSLVTESRGITMAGMAGGYVATGVSNWARSVILWNLALDQNGEPNEDKPGRRGVVTVNNTTGKVSANPEYFALAHLSAFAQPGAHRCLSPSSGPAYQAYTAYPSDITTTALVNPDGSVVLYAYNGAATARTFRIVDDRNHTGFTATMVPGELSTFVW